MKLFDIGVNLTDRSFASDLDDVMARARDAGVAGMAITGTTIAASRAAAALAARHPTELWSTAGVHPHHASELTDADVDVLRELSEHARVVAIGECGLDYNRNFSPPDDQMRAFRSQLDLAAEVRLPVFVHERDAGDDMAQVLTEYRAKLPQAVVHCFTGDEDTLRRYVDLDVYIGITGWICDERRGLNLRDIVGLIPSNRLLVETDAPYLLPRTLRPRPKSRRNEPAFLTHVVDMVAECRGTTATEVAETTWNNAIALFGLQV